MDRFKTEATNVSEEHTDNQNSCYGGFDKVQVQAISSIEQNESIVSFNRP